MWVADFQHNVELDDARSSYELCTGISSRLHNGLAVALLFRLCHPVSCSEHELGL